MWIDLDSEEQLKKIQSRSFEQKTVIFKHSTRCSISSMVKSRLERSVVPEGIAFYYLDLIKYRAISNQVAEMYNIPHESPQLLLIHNGECIYDRSHMAIRMEELEELS